MGEQWPLNMNVTDSFTYKLFSALHNLLFLVDYLIGIGWAVCAVLTLFLFTCSTNVIICMDFSEFSDKILSFVYS